MTERPWTWRRHPGRPPLVLAHRGGRGPWKENSLEAFSGALSAGADGVELDVRRSADGELVVHHDAEIAGAGLVHELRRPQIPEWVPTLGLALATCAGAIVNVEIKNVPVDPGYDPANRVSVDVAAVLADSDPDSGAGPESPARPAHVMVSSFWPDALGAVSHAGGAVALGLLVHPALDAASALDSAFELGCVAVNPHHSQVDAALVERAHSLDLAVVTWTVNTPDELDGVVDAGVDIVITDSVADTLAHLGRS
jgi:glycerophosphoryl diester phosphodiesterase